jgi:hypothetical protein
LFPLTDELLQRLRAFYRRGEEVHVIGHDDETPDLPAVARFSGSPLFTKDRRHRWRRKDRSPAFGTGGDEEDRAVHPNLDESTEMRAVLGRNRPEITEWR